MTSDTKPEQKVVQPAAPKPTSNPPAPKPAPSPPPTPRDPVDALGQTAVDILKQKLDEKLR